MTESRLDAGVAARGLARSRTHAARLIADGSVTVDGIAVLKPATRVVDTQVIAVTASDHYVSRAAHKLIAALDAFAVPAAGRLALDAGASTGGFSQVLLERGAARVIAVDVGHGQLAPLVAEDPRVVSVEGFNVRYLTAAALAQAAGIDEAPSLVVGDLSFISLTMLLPALVATAAPGADFVLLIKPQFEVGRTRIKEGVVREASRREDAVIGVLWSAWDCGLGTAGIIASPVLGSHGNHEYLAWLSASAGRHPTEWLRQIRTMVGV
ncbi:MAG: TlyA family RNA methyltransferase [Microbacteriaceae bacterium]|nr:MAG: TlyA family RNA methyltransferase [Microbacteriaceae bacterium]